MAWSSERSRQLVEEAGRRGWSYAPTGQDLRLHDRWKWRPGVEHPFRQSGPLGPGRHEQVLEVLCGATPARRPFWAFWIPRLPRVSGLAGGLVGGGGPQGHAPRDTQCIAFIYTATALPTVGVISRQSRHDGMQAMAHDAIVRSHERRGEPLSERSQRRLGWLVGSDEFRAHYTVQADDRQAAEWLAGPTTEHRLLADTSVSLNSIGADVIAWCDRGRDGEGFDTATVDALLEVLDTVPLG